MKKVLFLILLCFSFGAFAFFKDKETFKYNVIIDSNSSIANVGTVFSCECALGGGAYVTYDANGGNFDIDKELFSPGANSYPTFKEATKDGYDFLGWYYNDTLVNSYNVADYIQYTDDCGCLAFNSITVVAKWSNSSYKVTLVNDGNVVDTRNVEYNSKIGSLPVLYKDGSIFAGWWTKSINGTLFKDDTLYDKKNDMTLYAHWLEKPVEDDSKNISVIKDLPNEIKISQYKDYLYSTNATIKDLSGVNKATDSSFATGDTITSDDKTYTIVILGDISSDGKISTFDYVKLWNHLDKNSEKNITNDYQLLASDVNSDGKVSTLDYVVLWNNLSK